MNRRTFVVSALSLSLPTAAAGCLDGDGEDEEEEFEPGDGTSREVRVDGENLLRRADSLIRQDGAVFVTVRLENAGTGPVTAEVTLQMRDAEGGTLGSPFSQRRGPIAPGQTVQMRFETALGPQDVGGYELTITEVAGEEETADADPGGGAGAGNETGSADSE